MNGIDMSAALISMKNEFNITISIIKKQIEKQNEIISAFKKEVKNEINDSNEKDMRMYRNLVADRQAKKDRREKRYALAEKGLNKLEPEEIDALFMN